MENEQYIESGLSVGAVKYVDPNEIITEAEYNYIKNKVPELDGRVGVIEDEIEEINSSLDNIAINVDNFGAKGDGLADDTFAIQKAIDEAEKLGGGTILFKPNKVYRITYTLLIGSNIKLIGYGATIYYDSSFVSTSGIASRSYDGETPTENVIIEGITINTPIDKGSGIGIPYANNCRIINVKTTQLYYHLVDMPNTRNTIVSGCTAINCLNPVFQPDSLDRVGGLYIETSQHTQVPAKLSNDGYYNIIIEKCNVIDCGYGVQSHRKYGKNLIIRDCYFENNTKAIFSDIDNEVDNILIENNTFLNCTSNIHLQGIHNNVKISNNNIKNSTALGIVIENNSTTNKIFTSNHEISSNYIENVSKAMVCQHTRSSNIFNNTFLNCSETTKAESLTMSGSRNPTSYALMVNRFNNVNIYNNTFIDCLISSIISRKTDVVCDGLNITNNYFKNSGNAITISQYTNSVDNYENPYFKNIKIIGNTIDCANTGFYPIGIGCSKYVTINNNVISCNRYCGVTIDYSSECIITDNTIVGTDITPPTSISSAGLTLYGTKAMISNNKISGWIAGSGSFPHQNVMVRTKDAEVYGDCMDIPYVELSTCYAKINYPANEKPTRSTMDIGTIVTNTNPIVGEYSAWIKLSAGWGGINKIEK